MTSVDISCPLGSEGRKSMRTRRPDARQSRKTRSAKSSHMSAAWHLARFLAASFRSRKSSQSGTSSTHSAISPIAVAGRRAWHSHCNSMCRGNVCTALGTSEGVLGTGSIDRE
jgi:hypothetical protein